jgi:MSHA biogenesis protein MshQ
MVDGNQTGPHRYRFTIDSRVAGSTLVSVDRDTGNGFTSVIAPFNAQNQPGQAAVPDNFMLSLTGSTGGSNNIHELDNLRICALRSTAVGEQIDHFEFDFSGQALTCKPEVFTVRACKNAACSELVTGPVTATLSPVNGGNINWLGGNSVSFSGGQTSVSLRRTEAGSTTIGVSASVPATKPLSQTLCRAGGGALSAEACSISFADSGLVFDIPDGIANQPQQNILLSAVRKDDVSQQCVPEFTNVSRNIAFWSDYITPGPADRVASQSVLINDTAVSQSAAGATVQTLNFDTVGVASIKVNYADAGLMQLNARYSGSAATGDSGLLMIGADQFVRRPAGLCIQTGGECASADSNCAKFATAGAPFALKISAHRFETNNPQFCANPVTPSFSKQAILLSHSLLAPAAGNSGVLGTGSYNHQAAVTGENSVSQSISEVGVFQFHTAAFSYLGMADAVPAASSGATGRFVPASFALTAGLPVGACASFSYFAQPSFSTAFTLQAHNALGQRTQNYQADFARINVQQWTDDTASTGLRFSAPDLPVGSALTAGALAPVGDWQQGEAQLIATHTASRPSVPAAPLALTVYAAPVDSDGVTGSGAITSVPTELRYGRLVLANAAGPEEEALPLSFATEYWQGERFVRNLADSCSTIIASPAQLTTTQGTPALVLNGSNRTVQQGGLPAQHIWLEPANSTGNWQIEYRADPWLQYYWRGTETDYQQNPQADIMFGRFRGNPRQISWRELFQ